MTRAITCEDIQAQLPIYKGKTSPVNSTLESLMEMLTFMRPHKSVYEDAFINRYLRCLPGINEDKFGNLWVDVGDDPIVLWSSHTDTVHYKSGFQTVMYDKGTDRIKLDLVSDKTMKRHQQPNCLGADCTTGVWLMINMIKGNVPGRYLFHRDEEAGGNGSKYVLSKNKSILDGILYAIAFDRKGTGEIVTHQRSVRCASDKAGDSLNIALGGGFSLSDKGMFTDTYTYRGVISECFNVSVGYEHAHCSTEYQVWKPLKRLLTDLLKFDQNLLVSVRKPVAEVYTYSYPTANPYKPFDERDDAGKFESIMFLYKKEFIQMMLESGVNPDEIMDELRKRTRAVNKIKVQ